MLAIHLGNDLAENFSDDQTLFFSTPIISNVRKIFMKNMDQKQLLLHVSSPSFVPLHLSLLVLVIWIARRLLYTTSSAALSGQPDSPILATQPVKLLNDMV